MKITRTPFSHRKVLIVTIAIFVVLIVIPVILVLTTKQSGPQITKNVTPTPALTDPFTDGSRAQQATYSIAMPQNSQTTTNTFTGGTTLIIQPPANAYPGEPVLDVEAYNSKQNLTQKEMFYVATGASVNELDINDMKLPELKNTYQMRTINSKPIHTPTQLRIAYLVEPNALYVFRMYYSSTTTIPEDEGLFTDFISSFSLKQ